MSRRPQVNHTDGEATANPDHRLCASDKTPKVVIYTVGHSNHQINRFVELLMSHGISCVADVRSAPYSRFNPQFNEKAVAASLRTAGIFYIFLGRELGARPDDPSCYKQGQADFSLIANRDMFRSGIRRLLQESRSHRVALMCAEKEPLDCHRTILVSRELVQLGVSIQHILADGSLEDHPNTENRLIHITGSERTIFDHQASDSEIVGRAYQKRAQDIAYKKLRGSYD